MTRIAGLITVVLIAAVLAVQSPAVQGYLLRRALSSLAETLDGDITFESVQLRPFHGAMVKNLAIVDRRPYNSTHPLLGNAPDTLVRISSLSATFSIASLANGGPLRVKNVLMRDAELNLVSAPVPGDSSRTELNLLRVLGIDPNAPDDDTPIDLHLALRKLELQDVRIRYRDYASLERRLQDGDSLAISSGDRFRGDWIDASLELLAGDVSVDGSVADAHIRHLSLHDDASGLGLDGLSGVLHVDENEASLTGGVLEDAFSRIRFNRLAVSGYNGMDRVDRLRFEVDLQRSHLDLRSAEPFVPALEGRRFDSDITGSFEGTLDHLRIPLLKIHGGESFPLSALVTGRIRHLADLQTMEPDIYIDNLRARGTDIDRLVQNLLPGTDPGLRKYFGRRMLTGSARLGGRLDALAVEAHLRDGSGTASAKGHVNGLISPGQAVSLDGEFATDNYPLGTLLNMPELEGISLRSTASATLSQKGPEANITTFHIDRLRFMGYDYSGIEAKGVLKSRSFKGHIVANDPNLDFMFSGLITLPGKTENGQYSFTAHVGYANLSALHLDKRETAQLDFSLFANYEQTPDDDFSGTVLVRNLNLTSEDGLHPVGDISITSHSAVGTHTVALDSKFATARFDGSESVTRFVTDLLDATVRRDLPSVLPSDGKSAESAERGDYSLAMDFADTRDIVSFFMPGLFIAQGTSFRLELDREGMLGALLDSEGLIFGSSYVKNIGLTVDNADGVLSGRMKADEVGVGQGLCLKENHIEAFADDDAVDLRCDFDIDGTRPGDGGDFHIRGFFSREADDDLNPLMLTAEIPGSTLTYQGTVWDILSDGIRYRADDLQVSGLRIASGRQFIQADGRLAPIDDAAMTVTLQDFDLALVNTFLDDKFSRLNLKGLLSGNALLVSPYESVPNLEAKLVCRETEISGYDAGTLHFASDWQEDEERFSLRFRDEAKTVNCSGYLYPGDMSLDMAVKLNGLQIGYAAPLLRSVFSDFEGQLYGFLDVNGPLDKLRVNAEDTRIEDGLLQIAYTDVPYLIDGPVQLSERYLLFDGVSVRDRYNGTATAKGGVYFDHFKHLRYDLSFKAQSIECLDLSKKQNDNFYGNVFGSGDVAIKGDLSAVSLGIHLQTAGRSTLHIPFDYSTDASAGDLLRFREPERPKVNQIDSIITRGRMSSSSSTEFNMDLHAEATPDLQVLIEVDQATGNLLSAVGSGGLDLGVHKGKFTINGDYGIEEGNYRLSAYVATRDFKISQGSSIHFNGDIFDSDLDVKATYSTKASLAPLLADSTSTRRPVDCIVSVGDKLSNPSVDIKIEIPDLDPTTEGLVSGALNTQDNIQRQFLALLVSGNFLPAEQSGIVSNNSNLLFSNVAAIMSDQLNNILENLGIPLDLGLNYQSNESGNDLFDVAISTQLFNDRVIVNGNIGNRQYTTSDAGTSDVVGDLDIAIKLNKTGSIRATLFSHSADQYTNYLDNSQRNGAGFSFQKEFSTPGSLLRSIFLGKGWNANAESLSTDGPVKTIVIPPDDIPFPPRP